MSQLSLMSQFGEIEDEDRDYYNRAFDAWQEQFSKYATLYRYRAGIKGWAQTDEQYDALYNAVSDDAVFHELQYIDLGSESLNLTARNMVHTARMNVLSDRYENQHPKKSRPASYVQEQIAKEIAEKERQEQLLQDLETREELLALEKDYETEQAAKRSVYYQRAQKFDDIKPVIARQANWHGTNDYDERGDRIGVHTYTYKLTFELIDGEQTCESKNI